MHDHFCFCFVLFCFVLFCFALLVNYSLGMSFTTRFGPKKGNIYRKCKYALMYFYSEPMCLICTKINLFLYCWLFFSIYMPKYYKMAILPLVLVQKWEIYFTGSEYYNIFHVQWFKGLVWIISLFGAQWLMISLQKMVSFNHLTYLNCCFAA